MQLGDKMMSGDGFPKSEGRGKTELGKIGFCFVGLKRLYGPIKRWFDGAFFYVMIPFLRVVPVRSRRGNKKRIG